MQHAGEIDFTAAGADDLDRPSLPSSSQLNSDIASRQVGAIARPSAKGTQSAAGQHDGIGRGGAEIHR